MKKEDYINLCNESGIAGIEYSLLPNNITKKPIKLICQRHGVFETNPYHFRKQHSHCKYCKLTISCKDRIIKKYGNKYDLSKFNLKSPKDNVIIIEDGIEYSVRFDYFMDRGIIKEVDKTKLFIEKSIEKHGNKFNYNEIKFKTAHTKVKIKCNKHDFFFYQTPNLHLTSDFCCPKCKNEYKSESSPRRNSREKFIQLANEIHDNKYDYSKVVYKNNKTPVIIIYDGKEYEQRPDSHLQGKCPEQVWKTTLLTEEFIERAMKIHGKRYDYSKVDYKRHNIPVEIICPEHGPFLQTPNTHINRCGCISCNESMGERAIRTYLEFHGIMYQREKTFDGCKNKQKLPFDFYLEDYNICIEFDGKQHFEPIEFFGGKKAYKKLKRNDNIKTKFCKENNITLIRLSDKKEIENEMNKILSNYKKITPEEKTKKFIEKSRSIWGYKYEYEKTKYVDSKTPVIITYKGVDYIQTPVKHLQKKHCELTNSSLSREEFLRRCREKWGERFDYTNTHYKNSYSDIEFYDKYKDITVKQKASSHMDGNEYLLSKDNFIRLAEIASDFRCDYDNIDYTRLTNQITLHCRLHGSFKTRGYDHLNNRLGGSCKKCSEYEILKKVYVFLNNRKIPYFTEHRFDGFFLPFDFYIPSARSVIEIMSQHHFSPVEDFGGVEIHNILKQYDKLKQDYCEEHFINLIKLRWNQTDYIDDILWENLRTFSK